MSESPIQIGIAVVEHHGRYLIGVRPEGGPLAGCAEFPGGKCHAGETTGLCARRECLEETGLEVQAVDLLMRRPFTYSHGTFDLHFWLCHPASRDAVSENHNGYRWVSAAALRTLKFPDANLPLVEVLSKPEA